MAAAKTLIVLIALAFGIYRIVACRRAGVPVRRALGLEIDRTMPRDLVAGLLIGFAGIASILTVEVMAGLARITDVGSPSVLLNDWVTWIMVPVIEELLFRSALLGGLLLILARKPWVAIAIAAAVFGGAHALNQNATALAVIGSTIAAGAYGVAFATTGKLWLPIGLHLAWNYAQGPLFGFPLSGGLVKQGSFLRLERLGPPLLTGGSYGPEGGVIGLVGRVVVIGLLAGYLWFRKEPASLYTPHAGQRSHSGRRS